jgi:hypothetical protein
LVFDSTDILLPSWLSGKVSARQQYGCEFAPHYICFFNSLIKNLKNFQLLLEKKYVNNFTLCEERPFTFHVTAGNCSRLLGQCTLLFLCYCSLVSLSLFVFYLSDSPLFFPLSLFHLFYTSCSAAFFAYFASITVSLSLLLFSLYHSYCMSLIQKCINVYKFS